MIQAERIQKLNTRKVARGRYTLYWMQQSQRAEYNHALEYAIERANSLDQPLLAVFGLTDDCPEANLRHYAFMLEGLRETQAALQKRGVQLVVGRGNPA
ncbi:MAG: deoxyribodipyrimidine photo-lyase, partial [Burkholderiales bacterium]